MSKKIIKASLVAFLIASFIYFLVNLGITCYFFTKPHNRQYPTLVHLLSGVVFFSVLPLLSVLFSLKRFRYLSLVFATLSLFFLVALFSIKDSIYWSYIKEISEASASYLLLPFVDKAFIVSKVIAYPLLTVSSFVVLILSIFNKGYYLNRPVNPV